MSAESKQLARAGGLAVSGRIAARCGGALLAAACVILAFPNPDLGWIAWIALVPLLLACEGVSLGAAFGLGLLSGIVTAFGIFGWLFEVPGFRMHHALILALYVGLYTAAWCGGLPFLKRARLPLLITGPALWVVLDYLSAHAGFLALPWATLAHSQHKNLAVLQVASLTGEDGVTYLVVMANVAIAGLLTHQAWRGAVAAGLIIGLVHAAGAIALTGPVATSSIQVAVVQPRILIEERKTVSGRDATLERLERLTLAAGVKRPALIVWPETAVGDLQKEPAIVGRIQALAQLVQVPLVVGASESFKLAPREAEGVLRVQSYNSAYFVMPGLPLAEPYRKMRLLPFGEYLPLDGIVPWPSWFVPKVFDMTPGEVRRQFTLPDGTRIGALICWENLFADFVRPTVREGAQLLVQLTNDAWFGSTAAPRQHNLASVLRAVENRTPVVIASNTGPSQIVDAYGRVMASVPTIFSEGVASTTVPLGVGGTPYSRFGDLFAFAAFACLLLGVIRGAICRRPVKEADACPEAGVRTISEPTHH